MKKLLLCASLLLSCTVDAMMEKKLVEEAVVNYISEIPTSLVVSGLYKLSKNMELKYADSLQPGSFAICIDAKGVILDLNGYAINVNDGKVGILIKDHNAEIRNGSIWVAKTAISGENIATNIHDIVIHHVAPTTVEDEVKVGEESSVERVSVEPIYMNAQ